MLLGTLFLSDLQIHKFTWIFCYEITVELIHIHCVFGLVKGGAHFWVSGKVGLDAITHNA